METRSRSSNEFTLHVVYTADGSCDQFTAPGIPCSNISSTIEDTGVLNVTTVLIPLIFGSVSLLYNLMYNLMMCILDKINIHTCTS